MAVSELPGNPNAVWTVKLNKLGKKCLNLKLKLFSLDVRKVINPFVIIPVVMMIKYIRTSKYDLTLINVDCSELLG